MLFRGDRRRLFLVLLHGKTYAGVVSSERRVQSGLHRRKTTSVLSSITVPVFTGFLFGHTDGSEYSSTLPNKWPNSCEATSPESSVCQRLRVLRPLPVWTGTIRWGLSLFH